MAGIGFQLNRMARDDGLGGVANAAVFGAVFSSGPWLVTAGAALLLQRWSVGHLAPGEHLTVQTILVYAFVLSTVIAGPVSMVATRATADLVFARDHAAISNVFVAAVSCATGLALLAASLAFGIAAELHPVQFLLAVAITVLLAQIWATSTFLTVFARLAPVMAAYLLGIATSAALLMLLHHPGVTFVLITIAAGLAVTLIQICAAARGELPAPGEWPRSWRQTRGETVVLALTGLINALALGIDKWILWWAPTSIETIGSFRMNPINDQASFLGLLTLVPGMTLVLVATETHFARAFRRLIDECTGTATYRAIEAAQRELATTILRDFRLLVVSQGLLAGICWVLAPEIQSWAGGDPRGIFGFRFSALGAVFHIIAIHATIVLSYYDLIHRVLAVWVVFAVVSAIAAVATIGTGFAGFGWAYMVGALAAAAVAATLLIDATSRLTYLLFVGNNPAAVGRRRRFA